MDFDKWPSLVSCLYASIMIRRRQPHAQLTRANTALESAEPLARRRGSALDR
jgi:hypothetical protein